MVFWKFWQDLTANPNGVPVIETFEKLDTLVWNVLRFNTLKSNMPIVQYPKVKLSLIFKKQIKL